MKYLIAHILKGEAGKYHENISRVISTKFGTEPHYEKLPPHVTIVPPFDWADKNQIIEALKDAVSFSKRGTFYIGGFDHFHASTIFLSILPSVEMNHMMDELRRQFSMFGDWDRPGRALHPHVTVAKHLMPQQFSAIWDFVSEEDPDFRNECDSLALFEHDGEKWVLVSEHGLSNGRGLEKG